MNRVGCFALGVLLGVVSMQVGLALYLRSGDFAGAAFVTTVLGGYFTWVLNGSAEHWR